MCAALGDTWTRLESKAKGHCCFCFSKGSDATHFSHSTDSESLTKISRNTNEIKYYSMPSGPF